MRRRAAARQHRERAVRTAPPAPVTPAAPQALHALAANPELYPTFVKTKCVPSLLGLLAHENSDISVDVLDLLQELTSAEDAAPDDLVVLVDALLAEELPAALMAHLGRLDESNEDEATAIHSTLSIFESLLEARPEQSAALGQKTGLLKWLLARIKVHGGSPGP